MADLALLASLAGFTITVDDNVPYQLTLACRACMRPGEPVWRHAIDVSIEPAELLDLIGEAADHAADAAAHR